MNPPFNMTDSLGRRSGYAYDYQQKIAAYTGWTYEYVEGSWPELLEKLKNGEIDLLSDVSYTKERESEMLFPSQPMGTEQYYIYVSNQNTEISSDDYSTLNGKKIGVNKGSVQAKLYEDWAALYGVEATIVELTVAEEESREMLERGEIDAYISLDSYIDPSFLLPICKIGSSDFYFAVKKDRQDLLTELDVAMSKIEDENRYYSLQLYEKYLRTAGANLYLTVEQKAWLEKHGKIRVGYQDNYLAFCATDENGELTGALKDYLEYAASCFKNVKPEFEAVAYPTAAAAIEAMKKGEVDCVFPANLTEYEAEGAGVLLSPVLMQTEMYAVVRAADQKKFFEKETPLVAVNKGNTNYEMFLTDHFPTWKPVYFEDTAECLKAIAEGKADCLLISNYRFGNISKLCDKYRLTTVATAVEIDYCFAVRAGETELYSILTKATAIVPRATVAASLSYYSAEDAKLTFWDMLLENIFIVIAVVLAVILAIVLLVLWNGRVSKKAQKDQQLISEAETDNITGLYNKVFFRIYVNRFHTEHPETPMDAVAINIRQFHSVNALHGRELGDNVLRTIGEELSDWLRNTEGFACREDADRFYLYCRHTESYQPLFDRLQKRLDDFSSNTNIRLRMGVAFWQEDLEPVQAFDRARTACSMARGRRWEGLVVFDEKLREREAFEQRLINDLRRAVKDSEFKVYYQPKYDISCNPPKLVGAEALVRWEHPELGMISPGDFIPLFEENGQIGIVDHYVWEQAAKQAALWRKMYGTDIRISINISRVDLFDPHLEEFLENLIVENGLPHRALKPEVTESAFTDNEREVVRVISRLREKGFEIEMDDFGSGYSSLNTLSAMPVDALKMDRAFIINVERDEKARSLVEMVLNLAKKLELPVIAEGVETETQLQLLKGAGCPMVQGFYFSRPLPVPDFEAKFLKKEA